MLTQFPGDENIDQIVGIVRHELGHWKYMHPLISLTTSLFGLTLMVFVFSFLINNHTFLANFNFKYESNFVSFMLFLQVYEGVDWFTSFCETALTRKMEFAADAFAAEDSRYKAALCKSIIKIHVENSSNLNPDPFYALLNFSHPQLTERLAAMGFKSEAPPASGALEEPILKDHISDDIEMMAKGTINDKSKDVEKFGAIGQDGNNYHSLNEERDD